MIYLDSNVFLFALLYDDKDLSETFFAKDLLKGIIEHKVQACSSVLTWDEVVYVVRKKFGLRESVLAGEKILRFPNLKLVETDLEVMTIAQTLLDNYSVRPRDAIHAATALYSRVDFIISEDSDFDRIKQCRRLSLEQYLTL